MKKYTEAEQESRNLIQITLEGLRYFETYDWLFLRTIVSFGYLGWIAYSVLFVLRVYSNIPQRLSITDTNNGGKLGKGSSASLELKIVFVALSSVLSLLLYLKQSPITYFAYSAFPLFFWFRISSQVDFIRDLWSSVESKGMTIAKIIAYILMLEVLVYSYFHREILSCIFLIISLWPLTFTRNFQKQNFTWCAFWSLSCFMMTVFTLLPVVKIESKRLM